MDWTPPRRRALRALASLVLVGVLASCDDGAERSVARPRTQVATMPGAPTPPPSAQRSLPAALRAVGKIACKPPLNGIYNCSTPKFDVTGSTSACTIDSTSFGRMSTDAPAFSTIDGPTRRPVAQLTRGAWVCVLFYAEPIGEGAAWSYVTAIPLPLIPGCTQNPRCTDEGGAASAIADECRVDAEGRYTSSCFAGWVRSDSVEEQSMGLQGDLAADSPSTEQAFERYGSASMRDGRCVVGAESDDLGQQTAVVVAEGKRGRRVWRTPIPRDPDYFQSRATNCTCTHAHCYVAIATDTASAVATSQTLLTVVKLDADSGRVLASRAVDELREAPNARSIWVDDPGGLTLKDGHLELSVRWRVDPQDAPQTFHATIELF